MLTYDGSNESLTARVECGPSNSLDLSLGEWPRLPLTARIERAQFHRARSASKKGTWPLPPMLADFFSILLEMGDERAEEWRCRYGNRRSFCATMGQFLQVAGLA